jgi:hypothetical protein
VGQSDLGIHPRKKKKWKFPLPLGIFILSETPFDRWPGMPQKGALKQYSVQFCNT